VHAASRLPTALLGVALLIGGAVLAVNFGGLSTWHARRSIQSVSWAEGLLRRIQPWKAVSQQPMEGRVRQQVWVLRIVGAAFAIAGVLLFLYGIFGVSRVTTN
jgi:hypothetical protein